MHWRSNTMVLTLALLLLIPVDATAGIIALSAMQCEIHRLPPGTPTGVASLLVDEVEAVRIEIVSSVENLLTQIVTPSGQPITPGNVESYGGEYVALEGQSSEGPLIIATDQPGFHYVYLLPSQGPGTYDVSFQPSTGLSQDAAVIVEVLTDSSLQVALLFTEPTVVRGRPAVLSAAAFQGPTPVSGATVLAFVKPPLGPAITLTLLDNGLDGDSVVGDGLFSGYFVPGEVGVFDAVADVTGLTSGGIAFARSAGARILVVDAGAELLVPEMTDFGIDDNGNGLFDRLVISVPLSVSSEGEYVLTVTLRTSVVSRK